MNLWFLMYGIQVHTLMVVLIFLIGYFYACHEVILCNFVSWWLY